MSKKYAQASLGELWHLAYPLIVLMASQVVMQFADRMFLAWHSHDALAACVPAGVLAMTFGSIFMGLASYTSVFISQYYAKKKYASVTVSLWQGVFLAVISSLLLAGLTPVGFALINAFGHDIQVRVLELKYFGILNLFGGIAVINNALASFFSGRGQTKIPMWTTLIGNLINIGLDYVMIFGKLGFPEMGIAGAAWGTIISQGTITAMFGTLIFARKTRKEYKISKLAGFYKPVFSRLLRFGLPNGFGFLMDILSFTLFTFMVGNIDTISLQASNVVMSMQPVVFTVILGLGIGIQILVSKYQGIKRPDLSVRVVKNACKIGYVYAFGIGLSFFFGAPFFVNLFIPPLSADAAAIAAKTYPLIKLVSFFVIFDATYLIFGEAIRGAGDTKFYMYVMLFCAWGMLIPGTWYIVYKLHLSVFWVWSWLTFYAGVTAVLMWWRFLRGKWKTIVVTAE
ncbi:MAG: MATE family efflux transporter [Candidatus Avelusimicrobium sp.]|uniref:MATE family efflux transporter n=1 Tax=Candidatus Avelusimicrobium sp. TaxID=3048833 RepID=UPI003F0337C3